MLLLPSKALPAPYLLSYKGARWRLSEAKFQLFECLSFNNKFICQKKKLCCKKTSYHMGISIEAANIGQEKNI